jgi:DNA-binding CsgD family transcriptional regulator
MPQLARVVCLSVDWDQKLRTQTRLQRINVSTFSTSAISSEQDAFRPLIVAMPQNNVSDLLTAGFGALDLLNIGVVVCGSSGEMLVANDTAEEILRARDGLELDAQGVLCATCQSGASLAGVIQQVARTRNGVDNNNNNNVDSAFAVRRPSHKRALTLFVRAVNAKAEPPADHEAAVLVMILDAALPVEATELELRQLYGFTSTEAQLANLLMEGMALEDCGDELGIRRTTVRMHLRNIFAKTGARRQGELVALLLKSIGLGPRVK